MKKQSSGNSLSQSNRANALASSEDHGRGKGLQLYIPQDLYKSLKQAALDQDTTIRAVVLGALKKDGFDVKPEDLRDRRT